MSVWRGACLGAALGAYVALLLVVDVVCVIGIVAGARWLGWI